MLDGLFRIILHLSLGLLLVPFGGLEKLVHDLVLQVGDFAFEICYRLAGDRLRRLAQDLLDAAKVLPELGEGFAEGFVGGSADAVLLQRQCRVDHRTAPRKALNRFLGARDVRLHALLNVLFEFLTSFVGGFLEGGPGTRVDLLNQKFGFLM